jgi:uncharacterized membrane protein YqhA
MFNVFFALRYIIFIIVIGTFMGAGLMILLGVSETWEAFMLFIFNEPLAEKFGDISHADAAVLTMVGSVDDYLFGLVLIIFSYGIYMLYLHDHSKTTNAQLPSWLIVKDIEQLKKTLAQVIVIILFVKFLEIVLTTNLVWENLIIPISIALLAVGLKFLFDEDSKDE